MGEERRYGESGYTCHRPASRPYFLVTSSAEEEEVGFLISSVFSLIALALKRFGLGAGLRGENKKGALNCLLQLTEERDERLKSSFGDAIVNRTGGLVAMVPFFSPSLLVE